MQHTPGPWHIAYTHDDGTQIAIDDDFGMEGGRNYDLATVTHGDPEELRANARLIAAAPDLLAALRDLVACTPETYDNRHELRAAIDAIAQATGGAA